MSGSLGGRTMSPAYATAVTGLGQPGNHQILIVIGNRPDLCALMQAYVEDPTTRHANLFEIGLLLGVANSPATVTAGTYTATGNPNELTAGYDSYDGVCSDSGQVAGAGPQSVTLTSVGASYVGTFDVPFPTGTMTGSFDAPLCVLVPPGDAGTTTSTDGGFTCVP